MKKIKFNTIGKTRNYLKHLEHLFSDYTLLRNKLFSTKCLEKLQSDFPSSNLFLTHSATGALEMIAQVMQIQPGDEVIMPSYTFVSTANAFVNFGAVPVFVDINLNTLTLDIDLLEKRISPKTRAVIAVHYLGHSGDMEKLKRICQEKDILLIEDAATGFGSAYKGRALGTIGDFGVISFDSTKHISAIQGGLLIVNNTTFYNRLARIYHIGTNRTEFEEHQVSYYDWVDIGSKYQMNELNSAFLLVQLEQKEKVIAHRKKLSRLYNELLRPLEGLGEFQLMSAEMVQSNIHGFYLLFTDQSKRLKCQSILLKHNIESFTHYTALHLSPMGMKFSKLNSCPVSEFVANCILRLPLHNALTEEDVTAVCRVIHEQVCEHD
jgi:dTDP-4-amino-4,6-dideoxygalactose transaminase